MKFLKFDPDPTPQIIREGHERYLNYLAENSDHFSPEAYDFASADWHYDPTDHRCPHDAWIESFHLSEKTLDEKMQERSIDACLLLLGAYHDGHLQIVYESVKSYNLALTHDQWPKNKSHGDWLTDEISISDNNFLLHEIEFRRDGIWYIECENIRANWLPLVKK